MGNILLQFWQRNVYALKQSMQIDYPCSLMGSLKTQEKRRHNKIQYA